MVPLSGDLPFHIPLITPLIKIIGLPTGRIRTARGFGKGGRQPRIRRGGIESLYLVSSISICQLPNVRRPPPALLPLLSSVGS